MFKLITFILLTCSAQLSAQALTEQCNTSELSKDATAATALAYLQQDRQNLTSACVVQAIGIVRKEMYTKAIPTLTRYLDFKIYPMPRIIYDPLTQGPTAGLYPAVDALARFENSAVPALKSAVKDENVSKVGRLNAALALFHLVQNRPRQIRFTIKVAQSSRYPDVADALTNLAKEAVQYCTLEEHQQCSDAVNTP